MSYDRSKAMKARWSNPKSRSKLLKSLRSVTSKRSASMQARWQDPAYCAKHAKSMHKVRSDPRFKKRWFRKFHSRKHRSMQSENSKRFWANNPDRRVKYADNTRSANQERWKDPGYRTKQTRGRRRSWQDPVIRRRRLLANAKVRRHQPTPTEFVMRKILRYVLHIRYSSQVLLEGLIADFYLPEYNVILECDQSCGAAHKVKATLLWESAGYAVVRVSNRDVGKYPGSVVKMLRRTVKRNAKTRKSAVK